MNPSVQESRVYRRSSDVSRLRGIHIYSICLSVDEYDLLEDTIDTPFWRKFFTDRL